MKPLLTLLCSLTLLGAAESTDPEAAQATIEPDAAALLAEREGCTLLDLGNAVARSRAHRLEVQAARFRRAGAEHAASARLAFARPQVGAQLSYDQVQGIFNSRAGLPGADDPDSEWFGGVNARQLLYGFGARAAAAAQGRSDLASAEARLALAERDAAWQTRLTIGRIWHGRSRVAIALARTRLRAEEHNDATQLFQAGRIAAIDVRQAAIALIQDQDQLAAEGTALSGLADDLSLLVGLPADQLAISGELSRVADLPQRLEAARAAAGANSVVRSLDADLGGQAAQLRSLQAAELPQLHAVGSAGIGGNELDDLDDGFSVGLELSWQFDGGGRRDQRDQVREEQLALQAQRQLAIDAQLARLRQLERELAALDRRIGEQQRAIELAQRNYEDTRQLYSAGRVTLTRVSEANFSVTQARFQLSDLIFQENLAAFELSSLAE